MTSRPIILMGCGRLGSAIVEGWLSTGAVAPPDLIILTPSEKPAAEAARARGARINPPLFDLGDARALVLAVKPAAWREAAAPVIASLASDARIVSVMAGVRVAHLSSAFGGRAIARVMPTTAVATGRGVAAIWSEHPAACALARSLFAPMADVVDLNAANLVDVQPEDAMDVATAVAGSGPAYVHAFTLALAKAGRACGLDQDTALRLARGAARSAAASAETASSLDDLTARIASPGGTTQAGLAALNAEGRLDDTLQAAVAAALRRARDLSA